MKVLVIAVGKSGRGAESELCERYRARMRWQVEITEVEERRGQKGAARQAGEAQKLLKAVPAGAAVIALDERGKALSSRKFANYIDRRRIEGVNIFAFIIGGADGLDACIRERADLVLSLGVMTWPHLLARSMLMEQIYRASTILEGHPYHRD